MHLVRGSVCLLLFLIAPTSDAEEEAQPASAGGRLMGSTGERLNLIGDLWADLPLLGQAKQLYLALDARTSIEDTSAGGLDLAFQVQDLDYSLALGYRATDDHGGARFSAFAGQNGKQRVDSDGQAYVRYVAAGLESEGFLRTRFENQRFRWRLYGGPVVKQREVSADAVLGGELGAWITGSPRGGGLRLDLKSNGLVDDGSFDADWTAGPSLVVSVAGDRRWTLFAHYQKSDNPLGLREDAWLAGFEYAEGPGGAASRGDAPEIDGTLATGGGESGRLSGQFLLRMRSPGLGAGLRLALVVDANILTARETGDLYYFYHLGLERPLRPGIGGFYLYHRSNHRLAEPGNGFTSLNVLEIGLETPGWEVPAGSGRGALDWRARAGYLLDSTFGEERRWHARGGLRWTLPPLAVGSPYLVVEGERGDVERESYGAGLLLRRALAIQLEYRDDEQYYARDRSALLLSIRRAI